MANRAYPLKKSSSFREVALKSKKLRLSRWLTLQVMPSSDSRNYYGMTVSGKVANAVVRNKLKRWVRNCVQTEKWPSKYDAHSFVFVFKPQAEADFFTKLEYSQFKELFSSLNT